MVVQTSEAGGRRFDVYAGGALAMLLFIAGAVRMYRIGQAPLWTDEQVQFAVTQKGTWLEVYRFARWNGPFGPPQVLENVFSLWAWGLSRGGLRMQQALDGVAAVAAIFWLGRMWFSTRAGLLAAAFLSIHAPAVTFSREARPYALIVLLSILLSGSITWAFEKGGWRWLVVGLLSFAAGGAHPTTVALQIGIGLGMLVAALSGAAPGQYVWQRVGLAAASTIAGIGLSYLAFYSGGPTQPYTFGDYPHSLLFDLWNVYKFLVTGYWGPASLLPVAGLAAAPFIMGYRRSWRWPVWICLGTLAGACIPVVLSHLKGSFVAERYSIFALPAAMLLAAGGLDGLLDRIPIFSREVFRAAAPLILVGLLAGSMALSQRSPYDLERFKKRDPLWPALDNA